MIKIVFHNKKKDLEEIYQKIKNKYKNVFLIGHSIRGAVIYLSKIVQEKINKYYSYGYLVSKKMVNDLENLKIEKISKIIKPFLLVLDKKVF